MVALAGIVASFIAGIITWLARKFVIAKILLGVQMVIQGIVLVFIVAFFGAMVYLVNYIYELLYDFANGWNSYNPAGQVGSAFMALLDASGVGSAFVTIMNLYLLVLFLLLGKFLWFVFIDVTQKVYKFVREDIDLLAQ